ncbi:MAG: hypothetical protein ACREBU_04330 [Nitrososphaera sp.]
MAREGYEQLKEAWKKVGRQERRKEVSECGVCGCKSNLWVTVGSTMIGIRTILDCPGHNANPELHEKIMRKREILYSEMPDPVKEEIILEILKLRAWFAANVKPDVLGEGKLS